MKHIKCLFGFHTFKEMYNSGENCVYCHAINNDKEELELIKKREEFRNLKPKVMAREFFINMYKMYTVVSYFNPEDFEHPKRFIGHSHSSSIYLYSEDEFKKILEEWLERVDKKTDFESVMFRISRIKRENSTIDNEDALFSDEVVALTQRYQYVLDSIKSIMSEAEEYKTDLSEEVRSQMASCIEDTLSDIYKYVVRVEENRKEMKKMLDNATNESFLKRLSLESEYIEKIKGGA